MTKLIAYTLFVSPIFFFLFKVIELIKTAGL